MAVTLTTRLGLHRWSSDEDPWAREDFDADNAALEALAVIGTQGTAAARPAAGVERRLYYATDTKRLSLDDGAAWHDLGTLDTANTWAQTQTFGAIIVNGGLTAADGTLELGGGLAHIGTSAGFFGTTPIAKPGATNGLKASLVALGLITGGGATPLNLDGGALTAGAGTFTGAVDVTGALTKGGVAVSLSTHTHAASAITNAPAGNIAATDVQAALNELDGEKLAKAGGTVTGLVTFTSSPALDNGVDLTIGSGTGSRIGQAASKLGFFGATPAARPGTYNLTGAADRTLGAYASDAEAAAYTGAADGEAKLADLNALRVAYENLRTHVEDLAGVVIGTATDLKTLGILG